MARQSGILLPLASLPSPFGIGDLGPAAYRWLDWMHDAGQTIWSILPLLVPDHVGSPFTPQSAFAGNWMLISPERLKKEGWLRGVALSQRERNRKHIRYSRSNVEKRQLIGIAWQQFERQASLQDRRAFAAFKRHEGAWLEDYATYMAIKDRHSGKPWWTWPHTLRNRNAAALAAWKQRYRREIDYFAFGQWVFAKQWNALHAYAKQKRIQILGDIPYYVAHDSVDVWEHPTLFRLNREGQPGMVSGAPPDRLRRNGQLWGDPLYNWQEMKRTRFAWWMQRFAQAVERYDMVRLDHFRGYVSTWGIPKGQSARRGSWQSVPGASLFQTLRKHFPRYRVIAEDLGSITNDVYTLRDAFGMYGSNIAQWMLPHSPILPKFQEHSVVYTETHDMPTLAEWHRKLSRTKRMQLQNELHATPHAMLWRYIGQILQSNAAMAIIPMQDILGLGKSARLNVPGRTKGNWRWRMQVSDLTPALARKLKQATTQANRA